MRKLWWVFLFFVCGLVFGCGFLTDARNAIAAASTFLAAEQTQYQSTCTPNGAAPVCVAINKGIAANNALIDALNVYCSGTPAAGAASWNAGGPCAPVSTAQAAVQSATLNLNQVIADLKVLVGKNPAPPATAKVSLLEYRKGDLEAARGR